MKINIRTFAIAFSSIAVLAFSSEVIAIENLEVTSIENSRMIRMETSAPGTSSFDIFLMDKRNRSIYQERVDMGSSFEKVFDFTGFKDGTYTGNMMATLIALLNDSGMKMNFAISGTGHFLELNNVTSRPDCKKSMNFVNFSVCDNIFCNPA